MEIEITKSIRLTSKNANIGKREFIYNVFDEVHRIKNEMSRYCRLNLVNCMYDKKFKNNYKKWKSEYISAHTIQTLFGDVITCYVNYVSTVRNNILKRFYRRFSNSNIRYIFELVKIVLYKYPLGNISYDKFSKIVEKKYSKIWNKISDEKKIKIYKLYEFMSTFISKRIRIINFSNGTFRLTTSNSKSKPYEIVYDKNNKLYKYFLKLKFANKKRDIFTVTN